MNQRQFSRAEFEKLVEENASLREEVKMLKCFNRTANIENQLFKLDNRVDEVINELKVDHSEDGKDFEKCMDDYRKSKENLLEMGIVKLFDVKMEKLHEQYRTIAEEKKKKRMEVIEKLYRIKDSLQVKSVEVNKNVEKFVQEQERILKKLDLKSLNAIVKQEKELCAIGRTQIKDNASLFDVLQKALLDRKDQKGKITLSIEPDENCAVSYGNVRSDAINTEKAQNYTKKKFGVMLRFMSAHDSAPPFVCIDVGAVKDFLMELNLGKIEVLSDLSVEVTQETYGASAIVTFPDKETVDQLAKIGFATAQFYGYNVQILKYRC